MRARDQQLGPKAKSNPWGTAGANAHRPASSHLQFLNSVTADFSRREPQPCIPWRLPLRPRRADAKMRCGRLRLPHEPTRPQRLFRCSIFSCVVSGAPTAFPRVTSASAGQSGSTSRAVGSSARSDLSAHFCPSRRSEGLRHLSLGGNGSTARFQARVQGRAL